MTKSDIEDCDKDMGAEFEADVRFARGGVQRETDAKLVESMMDDFPREAGCRMALAIAAKTIRRGRKLTANERVNNLCKAIAEDDPQLADNIRRWCGS